MAIAALESEKAGQAQLEHTLHEQRDAAREQARKLYEATEGLTATRELASSRQFELEMVVERLEHAHQANARLEARVSELGRIERTLFILDWLQNVELRRRVHAGLNKGEARNALARAVFIHRLGEIRDRSFEQQRYRASGLNLVTAAIVLWNTVYLERATQALREKGKLPDDGMLQFLSPLGWEHINLTGDYVWRQQRIAEGGFRELRKPQE